MKAVNKLPRKLQILRGQIDKVDKELLTVLHRRINIVKKIGKLKKQHKLEPFDRKRWTKVLNSRIHMAKSLGISAKLTKNLFEFIHENSLEIQKRYPK